MVLAVARTHAESTGAASGVEGGGQGRGDHGGRRVGAAEDLCGFACPGGALLGQGARFVLGVAGLQGGLLGEVDGLDDRRGRPWSAWNAVASSLRRASIETRRVDQRCVQPRVDADDLAHRPLAAAGAGSLGEA